MVHGAMHTHCVTDLEDCKRLWDVLVRPVNVSDLWEFRMCFHPHFRRSPCFMVLEDGEGIAGMLPLCRIDEIDGFGSFPGETWRHKTWLERNPVYVRSPEVLPELLMSCPEGTRLRYLDLPGSALCDGIEVDEIGYVLYPSRLDFDLDRYHMRFSTKRLKSIRKSIEAFTGQDCSWHINRLEDFDRMVELNVEFFSEGSYLYDHRFRESFRNVTGFLHRRGMLRMVSLEIRGETVAVDVGALFRGGYTIFLGATHQGFPGVAKVMNMHHLRFAFHHGISKVDFLCGDFHWKKLWHLDPEPLYEFVTPLVPGVTELDDASSVVAPYGLECRSRRG